MLRSTILFALVGISIANASFLLRQHECNTNERQKKVTIFENKTVDFECVKVLCGDVELKLDDERNCTNNELEHATSNRPKCLTMNLATTKHVGAKILEAGQIYEGGVFVNSTDKTAYFDYISTYKLQDNKVVVWIDRLTCNDAALSALSYEVENIMVHHINNHSANSLQSAFAYFKEHMFHVKPEEFILFVSNKYMSTKLLSLTKNATVADVKEALYKMLNYPAEQQQLYFNDQLLDGDKALFDYQVFADASLRLELFEKLHLLDKQGKMTNILVNQGFSFGNLTATIEKQLEIATSKQQIYFEGSTLDADNFSTFQIQSGSILVVSERPPAKIYVIYDNKIFTIDELNNIDDLTAEYLYSRTISHFSISTYYYETKIYFNGNRVSKDSKLSEQNVKDGSILTVTREEKSHYRY